MVTIAEQGAALRRGEVSAIELLRHTFTELDRWESELHCGVGDLRGQALEAAHSYQEELERGVDRGPLHGIPIGVKDLVDMVGVPTTAGSPILADNVPSADAPVIRSLREAGAILALRTNTHQFAFGALTPPTRNPHDRSRMPGGSSGGSAAAVGAGILAGALGTDTAGSVREPAALCGAVGLKPTRNRMDMGGIVPLAWSLDTVGPIAATPADALALFTAMDPRGSGRSLPMPPEGVAGLRVAVWSESMRRFGPGVRVVHEQALKALDRAGAHVREVSLGEPDELLAATLVILGSEALSYHRQWLDTRRDDYAEDVLAYLDLSTTFTGEDVVGAERLGAHFAENVDAVLTDASVLVSPAQIVLPPAVDAAYAEYDDGTRGPRDLALIRTLAAFNLSGHPGVSVPIGHGGGFPISLQLVGPRRTEESLLRVAAAVQRACGYEHRPPSPP